MIARINKLRQDVPKLVETSTTSILENDRPTLDDLDNNVSTTSDNNNTPSDTPDPDPINDDLVENIETNLKESIQIITSLSQQIPTTLKRSGSILETLHEQKKQRILSNDPKGVISSNVNIARTLEQETAKRTLPNEDEDDNPTTIANNNNSVPISTARDIRKKLAHVLQQ